MLVEISFKVFKKDNSESNFANLIRVNDRIQIKPSFNIPDALTVTINYGEHFSEITSEDVFADLRKALEVVNRRIGGDIKFSFSSSENKNLNCRIKAIYIDENDIRAIETIHANLEPLVKHTNSRFEFLDIESGYALTRIWDLINILVEARTKTQDRNIILDVYKDEVIGIVREIATKSPLEGRYTLEELVKNIEQGYKETEGLVSRFRDIILANMWLGRVGFAKVYLGKKLESKIMDVIRRLEGVEYSRENEQYLSDVLALIKEEIGKSINRSNVLKHLSEDLELFLRNDFTLGGDPEIMGFVNIDDTRPTPAYKILDDAEPTTYYKEDEIGSIGTDGYNAIYEIRPKHSNNPLTLIARYIKLLKEGVVDNEKCRGTVKDFVKIWDSGVEEYPLGGHIHIGSKDRDTAKTYKRRAKFVVRELDRKYNLEQVFMKASSKKRIETGYARSSYRLEPWGFEYRTPPAVVWTEPKLLIPTAAALTLIAFRENLKHHQHPVLKYSKTLLRKAIEKTIEDVKKNIKEGKNYQYTTYKDDDNIILAKIKEAVNIEDVKDLDELMERGEDIYIEYLVNILSSVSRVSNRKKQLEQLVSV